MSNFKITIEYGGRKITAETPHENLQAVFDEAIVPCLLAVEFSPETISKLTIYDRQ